MRLKNYRISCCQCWTHILIREFRQESPSRVLGLRRWRNLGKWQINNITITASAKESTAVLTTEQYLRKIRLKTRILSMATVKDRLQTYHTTQKLNHEHPSISNSSIRASQISVILASAMVWTYKNWIRFPTGSSNESVYRLCASPTKITTKIFASHMVNIPIVACLFMVCRLQRTILPNLLRLALTKIWAHLDSVLLQFVNLCPKPVILFL